MYTELRVTLAGIFPADFFYLTRSMRIRLLDDARKRMTLLPMLNPNLKPNLPKSTSRLRIRRLDYKELVEQNKWVGL